MIGSGIFIVSAETSRIVPAPGWMLLAWIAAGSMTLIAASCCAELAASLPRAGGQYAFFTEIYSPLVGFLFGWTSMLVIQCGSIAAVAVAFAKFLGVAVPAVSEGAVVFRLGGWTLASTQLVAVAVILGLSLLNTAGVRAGKTTQNVFTAAKYCGLAALACVGLFFGRSEGALRQPGFWAPADGSFALDAALLALGSGIIGPLFAQSAWDNVAYNAEEVRDPARALPMALTAGCLAVTSLYLLTNIGYLNVLTFEEIRHAPLDRVASAAVSAVFGPAGEIPMAVVVMIATFGCVNGLILSASRVPFAMARDGLFVARFLHLNRAGAPAVALWCQGAWASLLVLSGGYTDLLKYIVSGTLLFDMLLVAALIRMRWRMPALARPFRAPGQPWLGILYLCLATAVTGIMMYLYPARAWAGYLIVLTGVPIFFWRRRLAAASFRGSGPEPS